MAKRNRRTFEGLNYQQTQRHNRDRREQLSRAIQAELKASGYRNVGWDNVIRLYQHLDERFRQQQIDDMSLEDLFLEADRIGNKYLTAEEQESNRRLLAAETSQIAPLIDQHFPDNTTEMVSFAPKTPRKPTVTPQRRMR